MFLDLAVCNAEFYSGNLKKFIHTCSIINIQKFYMLLALR